MNASLSSPYIGSLWKKTSFDIDRLPEIWRREEIGNFFAEQQFAYHEMKTSATLSKMLRRAIIILHISYGASQQKNFTWIIFPELVLEIV